MLCLPSQAAEQKVHGVYVCCRSTGSAEAFNVHDVTNVICGYVVLHKTSLIHNPI